MIMKIKKIKAYIYLIAVIFPVVGMAGPVTITAKLDSAYLLMGRQTGMHIEIVQDKTATGYVPLTDGDTLTRNVEIVGWRSPDTTDLGNNRVQINRDLILQSFDSGLYTLPPVLYISGKDTFRTEKMTLKVIPVNVDSLKNIHDYKNVEEPDTKWTDYLPDFITDYWWLILLIIAVMALAFYIMYRIRKGKPIALPLLPKKKLLPPYEEAVAALTALKTASLWQNGQEKEYYTRLTDILRHYIDRRFGVNAMEMTTSQILELLTAEEAKDAKTELRKILDIADFVKFAKMKPLADENEQSYMWAADFLEKTKPVENAVENQTEGGPATTGEAAKDVVSDKNVKKEGM